ncbi:hypothetical protein SAMN05660909_05198 [Chitinophaga terrae (ex Kim and Jung 2007)]|uniref:SnoaL-like domain-containing protein n=1 Tax=Chitinophaga terrae (ex Kim and Jung 2007) TaxID=408074 RepID=A0A1H4GD49_9BACT|nr:nuclear transport factor 2 family protein [Chitinophaga terrae (ex Kim and Jung 2007)]GEP93328.1 hypothetical protein CTE07_49730 [Chitinophaga terrae (ex Kim and Jung 2007)]SEB07539.1 hypothetical protein SAMN05660909_05198 [Chitinophaga terrae (ex Kim and Jung 2007)]
MKTDQLKIITISDTALEWLKAKYTAADALDAEGYRKFLAEDAQLQFGNSPIVSSANEIVYALGNFWKTINGMKHSFLNIIGTDNYFAVEALVDYTRKDDHVVQIPATTIIERNADGLVSFIRAYIDIAPIYHYPTTKAKGRH